MVIADTADKISVVIPFYSGAAWLDEALESVMAQSLPAYEVFVIIDGSNENIDFLVSKYRDRVMFIYQDNQGSASARNHGIRLATGDYIAFLDSDDLWLPNKLEIQLRYMKNNNLNWSHCMYSVFVDETKEIIRIENNIDTEGMIYPRSLARCRIGTPCVMIKRECLDDGFLFNEQMRHGQDYCFWNVLARKNRLGNVGESLVLVRDHNTNIAKNVFSQIAVRKNMYDYLNNNKEYFGDISPVLKLAFELSSFGYKMTSDIQHYKWKTVLSYILFFAPWSIFHIYYHFTHNN